jgi:hypothetical protein
MRGKARNANDGTAARQCEIWGVLAHFFIGLVRVYSSMLRNSPCSSDVYSTTAQRRRLFGRLFRIFLAVFPGILALFVGRTRFPRRRDRSPEPVAQSNTGYY